MAAARGGMADLRARRAWLAQAAASAGWPLHAASAMLVLEGVAAIAFAAALAAGLETLPRGVPAAAPWLSLAFLAALARGGCVWASAAFGAAGSATARATLRRRAIVACLGRIAPPSAAAEDPTTLAVDAVEQIDGYVSRFVPARRAAMPVTVLVLLAAALASPVSAAILAATLVPFTVLMALAGGAAADESRRQFDALARLSAMFADRIRALPAILCFGAVQAQCRGLAAASDEWQRRTMGVLRVAFISSAGLEFFAALSVALVAVYAGFDLLHLLPFAAPETLGLAQAVFVLALAPEFYAPMRRLAAAYHDRQAAETASDRLMALTAPAAPPAAAARPGPPPCIRFEAATVRYAGHDRPALDRLSFEVCPGEIVALIGASGAGKTTALKLLLGLAPLTGGDVLVNGVPLPENGSWAASIAWMGQNPVIMAGSIAENIALSQRDATSEEIASAARQAGLCAALLARPDGLQSPLDERGGSLSGGERRRVALARALVKKAPILLLDEPTAHLDATAEAALIAVIREVARGRTTLLATHSPALAGIAHRIVHVGEPS
jgi:ATP-binding cassette subfamily C protein CydD